MSRLFSLAALGIAATGLMLAMPSASQAQDCDYRGYGSSYGGAGYSSYGGAGFSVYGAAGYSGYGRAGHSGYGGHNGNGGYYDRGNGGYHDRGHGGYHGRRPVIVHPTFGHWTPSRGYHEHGHIHVPHRGHYHTYPY